MSYTLHGGPLVKNAMPVINLILIFIFLFLNSPITFAGQATEKVPILQLQTTYPSPVGNYQSLSTTYLQLNGTNQDANSFPACDTNAKGKMYYDATQNQILMCDGAGQWISNFNLWMKDDIKKSLYPMDIKDSDPAYHLGLGTTDAPFLLTLGGDGSILAKTSACLVITGTFPNIKITSNCNSLPNQGGGYIFTWYPALSALRAGTFDDDWDDPDSIGYYSIALGYKPKASGTGSTVSGGVANDVYGDYSTIAGGYDNQIEKTNYSTISGGAENFAYGKYSVVSGGSENETGYLLNGVLNGQYTTVSGGKTNQAKGDFATISGGSANQATGDYATIGGGGDDSSTPSTPDGHTASGKYSTIGGGITNKASNTYSTISGGGWNTASGANSTVSGGSENTASGTRATVAGGFQNNATGISSTVSGGEQNKAEQYYSTVSGGVLNEIFADSSGDSSNTISGGWKNKITIGSSASVISGGSNNSITGRNSGILSGNNNIVIADSSAILGGTDNKLENIYNFGAGRFMQTKKDRIFAFGWSESAVEFNTSYSFMIYAWYTGIGMTNPDKSKRLHVAGPVLIDNRFVGPAGTSYDKVALTVLGRAGSSVALFKNSLGQPEAEILADGVYNQISDIRLKKDIQPIPNALKRVSQLQGVNYRWKDESSGTELRMGLIAQDVEKVFPEIVSTDEQGYKSLAYSSLVAALTEAIKELKTEVDHLKEEIKALQKK